jgi:hypothetical protein
MVLTRLLLVPTRNSEGGPWDAGACSQLAKDLLLEATSDEIEGCHALLAMVSAPDSVVAALGGCMAGYASMAAVPLKHRVAGLLDIEFWSTRAHVLLTPPTPVFPPTRRPPLLLRPQQQPDARTVGCGSEMGSDSSGGSSGWRPEAHAHMLRRRREAVATVMLVDHRNARAGALVTAAAATLPVLPTELYILLLGFLRRSELGGRGGDGGGGRGGDGGGRGGDGGGRGGDSGGGRGGDGGGGSCVGEATDGVLAHAPECPPPHSSKLTVGAAATNTDTGTLWG